MQELMFDMLSGAAVVIAAAALTLTIWMLLNDQ
jgi:hypothetical protein